MEAADAEEAFAAGHGGCVGGIGYGGSDWGDGVGIRVNGLSSW